MSSCQLHRRRLEPWWNRCLQINDTKPTQQNRRRRYIVEHIPYVVDVIRSRNRHMTKTANAYKNTDQNNLITTWEYMCHRLSLFLRTWICTSRICRKRFLQPPDTHATLDAMHGKHGTSWLEVLTCHVEYYVHQQWIPLFCVFQQFVLLVCKWEKHGNTKKEAASDLLRADPVNHFIVAKTYFARV